MFMRKKHLENKKLKPCDKIKVSSNELRKLYTHAKIYTNDDKSK